MPMRIGTSYPRIVVVVRGAMPASSLEREQCPAHHTQRTDQRDTATDDASRDTVGENAFKPLAILVLHARQGEADQPNRADHEARARDARLPLRNQAIQGRNA